MQAAAGATSQGARAQEACSSLRLALQAGAKAATSLVVAGLTPPLLATSRVAPGTTGGLGPATEAAAASSLTVVHRLQPQQLPLLLAPATAATRVEATLVRAMDSRAMRSRAMGSRAMGSRGPARGEAMVAVSLADREGQGTRQALIEAMVAAAVVAVMAVVATSLIGGLELGRVPTRLLLGQGAVGATWAVSRAHMAVAALAG